MGSTSMRHPDGHPSDFGSSFARASSALEGAVLDLLAGGWEEGPRRLARGMATALRQAARDAGCWDCESALRALESLLALSPLEVASIRQAVAEKLLEFLRLLRKAPAARSA
ncbi:MAG TPA: hypothetical protein VNM14_22405 [Planctomycetota bacterium]|nr:hypothetical protein [Planctomycetota bacterium]